MLKKLLFLFVLAVLCLTFIPQLTKPSSTLVTVFKLTENPAVIVKGAQGSALTVNISFGEKEVEELLGQLTKPYPLLFVDSDWASRFPHLAEEIKKRSVPVALLGVQGQSYETDPNLFAEQLSQFEKIFAARPLWFRTADEEFPSSLLQQLQKAEINALGSTVQWKEGKLPKASKGEIISVSYHSGGRPQISDVKRLMESRTYQSVEDLLFRPTVKTKKIPQ
ncbi:hypothetical protein SporoP37_07970 [Sporosarcina sp. P37]|uniref:hypothetical protein n=1 Tax=unclassified Sporosarcina TaxID=2647733 RepID=UPI000A17C6F4|nr:MULTISPECIES: hypothetical protein [unclassified Sporosarcina]ARK24600.1 hypothetical protein SporoP37_07970 [Sporosarcina sp. P37]PID19758.1 hypothetical protein CSV62_00505 [Sporosarcina sp. P35]